MRAPVYKRKDSPYYWTYVYDQRGRRQRVSTKRTDRKAAEVEAARLQREAGSPRSAASALTVGQALERYVDAHPEWAKRTRENALVYALALAQGLGGLQLAELRREHIQAHIANQLRTHKASTVKQQITRLYSALRQAIAEGADIRLERLAVRLTVPPPSRHRWLTKVEVAALCSHLPGDEADWVWLACYLGARAEELNGIEWSHVDLVRGTVQLQGTKNERGKRTVPLASPARVILQGRYEQGKAPVDRLSGRWEKIQGACRQAGIEPCSAHDFRRTFASWLLQKGVGQHHIADLLGHAGLGLVRSVYARLGPDDLRDAVARLE